MLGPLAAPPRLTARADRLKRRLEALEQEHTDKNGKYTDLLQERRYAYGQAYSALGLEIVDEFEDIGFPPDLERYSYPALTKEFLYGVPVVLTLVPPLLLAVSNATRGAREGGDHGSH